MNNLRAEMQRNNISFDDIARCIGKSERTARDKEACRVAFTLPEAIKIRDSFFRGMSLEYLFAGLCEDRAS